MKYLIYVPFFLFVLLSLLIGCICYLWKFDKKNFRTGVRFLNSRIRFVEFINRQFRTDYY